jgi:DNA-binding NtrC family response regulator
MNGRVLIVDDEADGRASLAELAGRWGFETKEAASGREALGAVRAWHPEIILTDLVMPDTDGLSLLKALRQEAPECPVIMLTGRGTIQVAVQAIQAGAWDFVEKPVDPQRLRLLLERAVEKRETQREVLQLRSSLAAQAPAAALVGSSPGMSAVMDLVRKVAPSTASVVIGGESGTGKELVARAIHALSPRRDRPFVALNCSAIPATLIEAELFGSEKGAYTGADQRRLGCFELANRGTLFLDEIGELPAELQSKFLRVLEERRLRRLGGRSEIEVDVRVLCASHHDLRDAARRGTFREDLYFRLGVFTVTIPPLRERRDDIPPLVAHFIERFNADTGKRVRRVEPAALAVLQSHDWPGNVRELRNAVERAVILADGESLGMEHLPPEVHAVDLEGSALRIPLGTSLDEVEREFIQATLRRTGGNKSRSATLLGISEKTLYNKLHRYAAEAAGVGPAGGSGRAGDGPAPRGPKARGA